MGFINDEIAKKLDKESAIKLLQEMQSEVKYNLTPLSSSTLANTAIKRIPWLSKFLSKINEGGEALVNIGERVSDLHPHNDHSHESLTRGFHFGSVAMAAADFLRIPFIYVSAYFLGEEVPITLNNNARWLYSAAFLALTITALAVPVTAPVIGIVIAGVGLAWSSYFLGKILYERYELGRERRQLKRAIAKEEDEMSLIQQHAMDLEDLLAKSANEEQIIAIYNEIAVLQERYYGQKKVLEELKNKELQVEQKIQKVGMTKVLDKTMGIGLAALTVVGVLVSLFVPPVGAGILAGVAITGGAYLAARITAPLFKSLGSWLIRLLKPSPEQAVKNTEELNENSLTEAKEKIKDSSLRDNLVLADPEMIAERAHESTADVFVSLLGKEKAIEALKSVVNHQDGINNGVKEKTPALDKEVTLFPNPEGSEEDDRESESERPGNH